MTIYAGEASSKMKITGIVDGILLAVTTRLQAHETLKDETEARRAIRHVINEVYERSEEKLTTPKELVEHVAKINQILQLHMPPNGTQEPKMVSMVIRNLVQEAETLGKGK